MAGAIAASRGAMARSMAVRLAAPRKFVSEGNVRARLIHASKPNFAKDFVGEGLETDPSRGVRINLEKFKAYPGVPRSSEYESVLEQDPVGDTHGTGPNDDIWGEWGLDRDAPFVSTGKAAGMLSIAASFFVGMAYLAKYSDAESSRPTTRLKDTLPRPKTYSVDSTHMDSVQMVHR